MSASVTPSIVTPAPVRPARARLAERPVPIAIVDDDVSWGADDVAQIFPRPRSEALSRAMNAVLAIVALILLAPVFLVVALAVKLTSPGPVLYTQTRVGVDRRRRSSGSHAEYDRRIHDIGGRPFTIYKFRSMRVDAEREGEAVWATPEDDRVTPVGRVLRSLRLDETPQFLNVLLGDMNIVGPRPERPSILAKLRTEIREYPQRQRVKPGITGWSQINQSYDSCIEDVRRKVRYDLEYLQRQSFLEDVRIMARTLPVILFRRGAW